VDCPIGLPRLYAARHARGADFPSFLRDLAAPETFFAVAETLTEVSGEKPFYPRRGVRGMTRLGHAVALGLPGADALHRACDRATADRPAGAPPFWTLGANQSGKAAICFWRDVLRPALALAAPPRVWPFDGDFGPLLADGSVVIAETYPAEALRMLGFKRTGCKRRQADRAAYGPGLLAAMGRLAAEPDPALRAAVADGFGAAPTGEDAFDSLLGVLNVIAVVAGDRPGAAPADPWVRRWEGWVLGQRAG
jgi:hypothetical protein